MIELTWKWTRDVTRCLHALSGGWPLVLVLSAILVTPVSAGEPPLPIISVEPWDDLNGVFLAPSSPEPAAASIARVEVRNSSNVPIPDAQVVLTLGNSLTLCGSAILTATTDENGVAELGAFGSGCLDGIPLSGIIKANGVTIRAYDNVKSPDQDGDGIVGLADLVLFSTAFLNGTGGCHDYNDDGVVGLADLTLFGPLFVDANHCP